MVEVPKCKAVNVGGAAPLMHNTIDVRVYRKGMGNGRC